MGAHDGLLADKPLMSVAVVQQCLDLASSIAQALTDLMPPGGAIVFNSISTKHGTDRFFRRVFGLEMIHRSPEQLQALFSPAGFGDYAGIEEPLGVYTVVVGRKRSPAGE